MFGRANWAIVGLTPESRTPFLHNLSSTHKVLSVSQLAASLITQYADRDSVGINPFQAPRLDETHPVDPSLREKVVNYATSDSETREAAPFDEDFSRLNGWAYGPDAYALNPEKTRFGFWFVTNTYKDVSHVASIKEQSAYTTFQRPVKFLNSTDKKMVDADAKPSTAAIRKQFPVLVDFVTCRVYIASTSKTDIQSVIEVLEYLAAGTHSLAWNFEVDGHWPSKALSQLFSDTQYSQAFADRANEAARFSASEIEKLEDPELQKIVTKFFSSTNLGGDNWISLSAPAGITLNPGSAPIMVQTPTNATTLLGLSDSTGVFSAGVTIQERLCFAKKDGSERIVRKDTVTFEVNDSLNIPDVGAALLRGFDLPSFKKEILRGIRKSKTVPTIAEFWQSWLIEMNIAVSLIQTELLEILGVKDREGSGLVRGIDNQEEGDDAVIEFTEESPVEPKRFLSVDYGFGTDTTATFIQHESGVVSHVSLSSGGAA